MRLRKALPTTLSTDLNAFVDSSRFAPHAAHANGAAHASPIAQQATNARRNWSLLQRMAALLVAVLLPGLLAAWAVHTQSMQDSLAADLTRRNADTARALASLVEPVQHDTLAVGAVAKALLQRGGYRELLVRQANGTVSLSHLRPDSTGEIDAQDTAPAWFSQAFPLATQAGHAPISPTQATPTARDGGSPPMGLVRVEASLASAQAALWRSSTELAWTLLWLGACAAAVATVLLNWWRQPLAQVQTQARAMARSQWVQAPEPHAPELREITRALNAIVQRSGDLFASQTEQLARLQLRAQTDPLTGLALRQPFMGRFQDAMAHGQAPAGGLLLVRVADLQAANQSHGHESTDRMLRVLADLLLTYVERVAGTMAGRLNGCDFALFLPASGVVQETAQSIQAALAATPSAQLSGLRFLFGGCESTTGTSASAALATADAALARAEAGEILVVLQPELLLTGGARAWHDCIAQALERPAQSLRPEAGDSAAPPSIDTASVSLAAFPVLDESGGLVHLECLMRLQTRPRGEWLKAQSWLALARRSGLIHRVDWMALDLALQACAVDQQPRCIHVSLQSFANPEFALGMLARLQAAGELAALLSIEWSEALDAQADLRGELHTALSQAVAQWRALGVRIGVEHAGGAPKALPALRDLGVDYVKVDARHVRGVASEPVVHRYAASLVSLIQGLGMAAMAQGIDNEADLQTLQAMGFDAFTGPAVQPSHVMPATQGGLATQASGQALTDLTLVHGEVVGGTVGEKQPQGLAHGAEGQLLPGHFVFLEQPRLQGLRPRV